MINWEDLLKQCDRKIDAVYLAGEPVDAFLPLLELVLAPASGTEAFSCTGDRQEFVQRMHAADGRIHTRSGRRVSLGIAYSDHQGEFNSPHRWVGSLRHILPIVYIRPSVEIDPLWTFLYQRELERGRAHGLPDVTLQEWIQFHLTDGQNYTDPVGFQREKALYEKLTANGEVEAA